MVNDCSWKKNRDVISVLFLKKQFTIYTLIGNYNFVLIYYKSTIQMLFFTNLKTVQSEGF